MQRPGLYRQFIGLSKPYWRSKQAPKAFLLLLATIGSNVAFIVTSIDMTYATQAVFNDFQSLNYASFSNNLQTLLGYSILGIFLYVIKAYLQNVLSLNWRIHMAKSFSSDWLKNNNFYKTMLGKAHGDNPDQRISDDIRNFVFQTLTLSIKSLSEIGNLIGYSIILWELSANIPLQLFGQQYYINGSALWISLAYAVIATLATYLAGRKLIPLSYHQETVEADFRFSLMRVRERREEIALLQGGDYEQATAKTRVESIQDNYQKIIHRNIYVNFTQIASVTSMQLIPLFLFAPMLFSKAITLGVFMTINAAFGKTTRALLYLSQNFQSLADWKATCNRLSDFQGDLVVENARKVEIKTKHDAKKPLLIDHVTVSSPQATTICDFNFKVSPKEHIMISGPSGRGKSTLFRTIAGIWPFATGSIESPPTLRVMPQKAYFPIGTLSDALCYPYQNDRFSRKEIIAALEKVQLSHLVSEIDDNQDWLVRLSGGEQQRLSCARLILQKPDCVLLDEPAAALDAKMGMEVMSSILANLRQSTVLTISHHPDHRKLHDRVVEV